MKQQIAILGFRWKRFQCDICRHREQPQSFGIGQQFDDVMRPAELREQSGIACRDERSAARAEHVEGIDIASPPHIVEHQQHRFFGQQFLELRLPFVLGFKGTVTTETTMGVSHQAREVRQ